MSKPRTDPPLSSLDPRYRKLLLRGSRETFEIPCENWNQAFRLRTELHKFRKRLKDRGDESWEVLYNCIVSLPRVPLGERHKPATLVLRPRTSEFDSVLDSVLDTTDSSPPTLPHDPLEDLE